MFNHFTQIKKISNFIKKNTSIESGVGVNLRLLNYRNSKDAGQEFSTVKLSVWAEC